MNKRLALAAGCVLLASCSHMSLRSPAATASLAPTKNNQVAGTVSFVQRGNTVTVEARVTGLSPGRFQNPFSAPRSSLIGSSAT